jgi:hypothetical protein
VADWAVTLGQVSWDFYGYEPYAGSGVGFEQMFDAMTALIRSRSRPVLGKGLFKRFATEDQLVRDQAACERALALAQAAGAPDLVAETRVVAGWITLMRELYAMAAILSAAAPPGDGERQRLQAHHRTFCRTAYGVIADLEGWQKTTELAGAAGLWALNPHIEKLVSDVSDVLRPWGLANPYAAYQRREIGKWEDGDFDRTGKARMRWAVTNVLDGPGEYEVQFVYAGGPWGLTIARAALAAAPRDPPAALTEISVDEHAGVAALWSKGDIYRLKLADLDTNRAYVVVADISAPVPRPDQIGVNCQGVVRMRKTPPAAGPLPEQALQPMTPAEIAWYQPPAFTNGGLRVGIIRGGVSTEGLARFLRGRPGLDVQLLSGNPAHFGVCEVIVFPTVHGGPFAQRVLPGYYWHHYPTAMADLERFVRDGGGLVAAPGVTSDPGSVGFVGHSLRMFPEICDRPAAAIKGSQWLVVGDHPLTAGLRPNVFLPAQWGQQFVLEPGPRGTVVARANSGAFRPAVVVCGTPGQGRTVACGLYLGIDAAGRDSAPAAEEGQLLENAVRWAGGR